MNCQAIWPGTMAIMAGIDLLGKFLAGTDKTHGSDSISVSKRFKDFTERYLELSSIDTDCIYQLRNSLLHSFGLYSEKTNQQGVITKTYNFRLLRGSDIIVKYIKDDRYQIDVECLRELFEQAVVKYEADLHNVDCADYQNLMENFKVMLPKHAKPMSIFKIKKA